MEKKIFVQQKYEILYQIGSGGNSKVFKARDIKSNDIVAIKRYETSDLKNRARMYSDVERELSLLKNVSHPALPRIYNIVYWQNEFYLVMEYVEGITLEELLKIKGIEKQQIYEIGQQILSAMYYIHSLEPPIIYRDLKPANVICMKGNQIKLVDFGGSKRYNRDVSADAKAIGTPHFAAPEQYGDTSGSGLYNTDIRTDIYGVGALLYRMATGKNIDDKLSFIERLLYCFRFNIKFRKIVKKATRIYPKDRYQSDIEMLVDLYSVLNK